MLIKFGNIVFSDYVYCDSFTNI